MQLFPEYSTTVKGVVQDLYFGCIGYLGVARTGHWDDNFNTFLLDRYLKPSIHLM